MPAGRPVFLASICGSIKPFLRVSALQVPSFNRSNSLRSRRGPTGSCQHLWVAGPRWEAAQGARDVHTWEPGALDGARATARDSTRNGVEGMALSLLPCTLWSCKSRQMLAPRPLPPKPNQFPGQPGKSGKGRGFGLSANTAAQVGNREGMERQPRGGRGGDFWAW